MLYKLFSIKDLLNNIKNILQINFSLVWVKGEISSINIANSGHWYLTLKDEPTTYTSNIKDTSQVKCILFKAKTAYINFIPKQGEQIEILASVDIYEARGELQLIIDTLRPLGIGNLHQSFINLKNKLSDLGLFDAEHKKTLPSNIKRVAIITSLAAAALQDVIKTMYLKVPHIEIIIYPCSVQGIEAPKTIIHAIRTANDNKDNLDVIILCRGGGSLEDLSAFNDEQVALAMFNSDIPIIAGIGHESNTTIADMVASLRASTPTACVDYLGKTRLQYIEEINAYKNNLFKLKTKFFQKYKDSLILVQQNLYFILTKYCYEKKQQLLNLKQQINDKYIQINLKYNNYNINRNAGLFDLQFNLINSIEEINIQKEYIFVIKEKYIKFKFSYINKE